MDVHFHDLRVRRLELCALTQFTNRGYGSLTAIDAGYRNPDRLAFPDVPSRVA